MMQGVKRKPRGAPWTLGYFQERSAIDPLTGCWLWRGAAAPNGYGAMNYQGRRAPTHRIAYQIANDKTLPSSLDVCHHCDVRACCNPDHLFEGTRTDNMRDCANKGRVKTPVLQGEACPASKFTADQVRAIRADPRSNRALARAFGVTHGTISHMRRRLTWRSI